MQLIRLYRDFIWDEGKFRSIIINSNSNSETDDTETLKANSGANESRSGSRNRCVPAFDTDLNKLLLAHETLRGIVFLC